MKGGEEGDREGEGEGGREGEGGKRGGGERERGVITYTHTHHTHLPSSMRLGVVGEAWRKLVLI